LAFGGRASHTGMALDHTLNHRLRLLAAAIDSDHGSKSRTLQSSHGISAEAAMLPYAIAYLWLGHFENNCGNAADEQRYLVLEDQPGDRIRLHQSRLALRHREVDRRPGLGEKVACGGI